MVLEEVWAPRNGLNSSLHATGSPDETPDANACALLGSAPRALSRFVLNASW